MKRPALAVSLLLVALLLLHIAPPLRDRMRGPSAEPASFTAFDPCAKQRPDGTLPAACGNDRGDATLLFGGDAAEADASLPTLAERGLEFPFEYTLEWLRAADLTVINLEAPITDGGSPFSFGKQYVYRAPLESAEAMARAGIDVAGLANNHVIDYGARGLKDTLATIDREGMASLGAGLDEAQARRGLVIKLGALRVGLLARCERQLDWDLWVHQYASRDHAGVAALDDKALAADIAELRPHVDLIVLFVHWGSTYEPPTRAEQGWAERIAALGIDLIIGHHPHIAQPLALLGAARVPVAFSLGNYAFGTAGRPDLGLGVMLRAVVRAKRITRLELLPLDVQNRRVGYRPEPMHGPAAAAALAPLVERSTALGAALHMEGDAAVLDLQGTPRGNP